MQLMMYQLRSMDAGFNAVLTRLLNNLSQFVNVLCAITTMDATADLTMAFAQF
jgi:hypothetical protein